MSRFLAFRIIDGARDYLQTVTQYPQYKVGIDEVLIEYGKEYLIVEVQ